MHALPTLFDATLLSVRDERVGAARLWSLTAAQAGIVRTIPDLCRDVIWLPGEVPVVLDRTVVPLLTAVTSGMAIHGVRFGPAVSRIEIDRSWPGWRMAVALGRRAVLRAAMAAGALVGVPDPTLDRVLHELDRPTVRIAAVAREIGFSERQLLRVTTAGLALTPKEVHRQLRVHRFATAGADLGIAARAVDAGFYDQAHAANEIRSLTGLSARALTGLTVADSSKTRTGRWADDGGPSKRGAHDEVRVHDHLRP